MKVEELRTLCNSEPHVLLTLPRKTLPKTDQVRLIGTGGPLGRVCTVKEVGDKFDVVAAFESAAVLAWIAREEAR